MNYEQKLLEVASWLTQDAMRSSKLINGGSFLRARTGWERRGIKNGESIYEHVCKVALAAHYLLKTPESLDMGFGHDLPELIELSRRYKFNPVGEGGELETEIVSCPLFK